MNVQRFAKKANLETSMQVTPKERKVKVVDNKKIVKSNKNLEGIRIENTTVADKNRITDKDLKELYKKYTEEEIEEMTGIPQSTISY